jgi:hypothetical protein
MGMTMAMPSLYRTLQAVHLRVHIIRLWGMRGVFGCGFALVRVSEMETTSPSSCPSWVRAGAQGGILLVVRPVGTLRLRWGTSDA